MNRVNFLSAAIANMCEKPLSVGQCLLLLVVIMLAIHVLWNRAKTRNYPPTPWNLPIVGSLPWIIWSLYRSRLPAYEFLRRKKFTFGNVYALNFCGQLVVFLNDFQSIKEAFSNPCLCDRPELMINEPGKQKGLAFANGTVWFQQRRFTLATFRSLGVGKSNFEELIALECRKFTEEISQYNGAMFDPQDLLLKVSSNVICLAIFGKRYEYSDEEFQRLQRITKRQAELLVRSFPAFILPFLRYIQFKAVSEFEINHRIVSSIINAYIQNHKNTFTPDDLRDYTDVYINEIRLNEAGNDTGKLSGLDEQHMEKTISNLFSAGTGTTALTFRWILLCMVRYRDVQTRVQQEMDEIVGRHRLPMISDKHSLPYTQATLLEIQRFASVSRLGVPHACSSTTQLCGYTIPKGAIIMPNKWAIHHDPELWPDPEMFKPERFLDKDGKVQFKQELIPFGTGRRVCVGDNLAKMELFIFFTHLLRRFTLKGHPSILNDRNVDRGPNLEDFQLCAIKRD